MELNAFAKSVFDRVQQSVDRALDSLTDEELNWQPGPEANPIGFTLWHQIRAEDAIINGMLQQKPQVWITEKWYEKCNMPDDPMDSGGGYTAEQVSSFNCPKLEDLLAYGNTVRTQTMNYLDSLTPEKYDEVIKAPFGEFSIGQLIGLLISEIAQHTGHIGYVRGLKRGLNK